jgi:hypothetical protein
MLHPQNKEHRSQNIVVVNNYVYGSFDRLFHGHSQLAEIAPCENCKIKED